MFDADVGTVHGGASMSAAASLGNQNADEITARRWMCSDGRRAIVALIVSLVVPTLVSRLIDGLWVKGLDGAGLRFSLLLLGWNVFAVVYVLLTVRTFDRSDSERFRAQMAARRGYRSEFWQRRNPTGNGPVFAIEASVVAFAVVLVVPHIQGIAINDWVLVPISLTILLSCWAVAIVSYSLHYAHNDLQAPSLDFPGDRTNAYGDYLYFSIAIATTFGATDVNITTPQMRRIVNLHTILTFIYNSVIVALLASLLIR